MLLAAVFLTLFNFLLLAFFSTFVRRATLATYAIAGLSLLLTLLLINGPSVIASTSQVSSLGV